MDTYQKRYAKIERITKESDIKIELDLDDPGIGLLCETGIPFFDHMLSQVGKHSGMGFIIKASGDIEVDTHHSVEDVGIALGQAFLQALGDKVGLNRFSSALVPLDEALAEVIVDISGRGYLVYDVIIENPLPLGTPGFEPQLAEEFLRAFATNAHLTLHVNLRYGRNTHHVLEAIFKALGRSLKDAVKVQGAEIPSTKGML